MTMPRPSGKAQRIAQQVVPGLKKLRKVKGDSTSWGDGIMSEVETAQTNNIESRKGLKKLAINLGG